MVSLKGPLKKSSKSNNLQNYTIILRFYEYKLLIIIYKNQDFVYSLHGSHFFKSEIIKNIKKMYGGLLAILVIS